MTKKTIVRFLSISMCLLMLLTTMLSCTDEDKTTENSENDTLVSTNEDETSPYDENGYLKDSLDGLYYDGKDVNVLTWDNNPYLFPLELNESDEVVRLVYTETCCLKRDWVSISL